MNYIYIFLEIIFTFFLMIIFYSKGKKDGLYLYIALMSGLLSVFMFKSINLFSFEVNTVNSYPFCNTILISFKFVFTAITPIPEININIILTHMIFIIEIEAFSSFFINF